MQRSFKLMLCAGIVFALANIGSAQILNPSFDNGFGTPPDWTNVAGSTLTQFLPELGFPSNGFFYLAIDNSGTGPATPHSNPGGLGTETLGAATLEQSFNFPDATNTTIEFDCMFLSNDTNNDFLEASITDGTSTLNLFRLDISDANGPPSQAGLASSALEHVAVDIAPFFPSANLGTTFTLRLHCGNFGNTANASRAYFDNITLTPGSGFLVSSLSFGPHPTIPNFQELKVFTPQGARRWYNLISTVVNQPIGTGLFFGLQPDTTIFLILQQPVGTPGLHAITDANGNYSLPIFNGLNPSGFTFDAVLVVVALGGAGIDDVTGVTRVIWP